MAFRENITDAMQCCVSHKLLPHYFQFQIVNPVPLDNVSDDPVTNHFPADKIQLMLESVK